MFLSATGTVSPDPVALLMVLALALVVAVMTVRKYLSRRAKAQPAPKAQAPAQAAPKTRPTPRTAPGSAGKLKLHAVEPKTAAMLMAITAHKLGKPLNELRFISIKEVK